MKTIGTVVVLMVLAGGAVRAQDRSAASPSLLKATFGKLPLYFVENRGVYPDEVAHYIQGADKTLFFTKDGITFRLKGKGRDSVVRLELVGADPRVVPQGEDRQQAVFSYFKGPDKEWKTGLKTYSKIVYRDLWPGIDLVYKGTINRLKYEFVVAPGADPGRIRLRIRGATDVRITPSGALRIDTLEGSLEDDAPVAFQITNRGRVTVPVAFSIHERTAREVVVGFSLGDHDPRVPLVIDPATIVYAGFIGGPGWDAAAAVAVDAAGNAYVAGTTWSSTPGFPVKVGPDLTYNGSGSWADAFVAKIDPSGTLLYCGYIGGSEWDAGTGIDVDASGNAYVTGFTFSDQTSFPVRIGPDLTYNGPASPQNSEGGDAFVAKVNAAGTALVYCGYIGGRDYDQGNAIAVDRSGNAFVVGNAKSDQATFPVTVGPFLTWQAPDDAFVARVNASGKTLDYCGYLGAHGTDQGTGVAVDRQGRAYVAGNVPASGLPVRVGPDLTHNGTWDVFVARVSASGMSLDYCGYLGGSRVDWTEGRIAVDESGSLFVSGWTRSDEQSFPVRVGPDLTKNGLSEDAFIAKVSASGAGLDYCGYVGGSESDMGHGVAVDPFGNATLVGKTDSDAWSSFPLKGGLPTRFKGGEAFVTQVAPSGKELVYSGYVGGDLGEQALGVAADPAGNVLVAGLTSSDESSFPVACGPVLKYAGGQDAFVAKIAHVLLEGEGSLRPGTTLQWKLRATDDAGLRYQVGTSLHEGRIYIDKRKIMLMADPLLLLSVRGALPEVFVDYGGIVSASGRATASLRIPPEPALVGVKTYTVFVTLSPKAPSNIKSISDALSFMITKQ